MFFPILFIIVMLIGNLWRIPIGGGAITFLDIAVTVTVFCGICDFLLHKRWRKDKPQLTLTPIILIFLLIATVSTIWGIFSHSWDNGSVLYLPRLTAYFLLLPIIWQWLKRNPRKRTKQIIISIIIAAIGISLLGFGQLYLFPDFEFMEILGWDPHQNRLLSTWFDPNLTGGFLAFAGIIILALLLRKPNFINLSSAENTPKTNNETSILFNISTDFHSKKTFQKEQLILTAVFLIILTALFLTFSRSAWLSFAIGAGIVTLLRSWKILVLGIIIMILAVSFSSRAQQRIQGAFSIDTTASYRIESWQNSISLWKETPFLGIGYNYLRLVQSQRGLVAAENVHSAGGSDSTFLTVLVTIGILGALSWSIFFLEILAVSWRRFKKERNILALALFAGSISLFIDSWFANTLLFPFILVPWLAMTGVIFLESDSS